MNTMSATYSPDDNKLRLYSLHRLDRETYDRVKAAGFSWAPKQELFVAPMWTPEREDILTELCGEIGDEDTSLADRAEERAERFEEYSEKRADDAQGSYDRAGDIAQRFEGGQPILVGHHSERRARKDAERIQSGMRKAVSLWQTSEYWTRRAKGALSHAKYKELPAVRMRRIATLEADKRKHERSLAGSKVFTKLWGQPELTYAKALTIANTSIGGPWGTWSALDDVKDSDDATKAAAVAKAVETCSAHHARISASSERWIAHIDRRIAYEKAMMGELFDRMTERAAEAKKARAAAIPPLANFPGEGYTPITKAEYAKIHKDYKGTRVVRGARIRTAIVRGSLVPIFLTDSKIVQPPQAEGSDAPARFESTPAADIERMRDERATAMIPVREAARSVEAPAKPEWVDQAKDALRAGVQVLSAPQLFPTPPELAARLVAAADIRPDHRVLEPSAGTGNLLCAVRVEAPTAYVVCVELNADLARRLVPCIGESGGHSSRCADFLSLTAEDLGTFDRVVMNPPFAGGADVEHVTHALTLLRPGGRLVAVMSAGVRFRSDRRTAQFRETMTAAGARFEDLPPGSFEASGTGVSTVLFVFDRPGALEEETETATLVS
ncbi:MAG TPA: DUF3560 domain-containing protein [Polyangia bacterium]|nr:DUF3560 domain-containing protein [Polyangia bacterium]